MPRHLLALALVTAALSLLAGCSDEGTDMETTCTVKPGREVTGECDDTIDEGTDLQPAIVVVGLGALAAGGLGSAWWRTQRGGTR